MRLTRPGAALAVLAFSLSTASAQSLQAEPPRNAAAVTTLVNTHTEPARPEPAMPSWGSLFGGLPRDTRRLPSTGNALWLGGSGVVALAVHDQDARLTRRAVASAGLDTALEAGAFVGGGIIQVGGALGTFAIDRWSGTRDRRWPIRHGRSRTTRARGRAAGGTRRRRNRLRASLAVPCLSAESSPSETGLAFASNGADGTVTIAHLDTPDTLTVVQTLPTMVSAGTFKVLIYGMK